jgi:hypothetical protein
MGEHFKYMTNFPQDKESFHLKDGDIIEIRDNDKSTYYMLFAVWRELIHPS